MSVLHNTAEMDGRDAVDTGAGDAMFVRDNCMLWDRQIMGQSGGRCSSRTVSRSCSSVVHVILASALGVAG